ncbi:hypothetical protein G647_03454 [Cladophialophora carrionii CBS 160.54]|uniref:Uncharacterized protein n=1 Tax=Cladophialophora carrionii CBS 160.54 TaxID=1279043 RepID=V9DB63_9EURO|nr:uncharacterized protein G647_03454 [Cladophialophora carrionii CBS 160.54]ETI24085.1 hypothetical protein G647_03454 [Cladophialophora carrionii CBS 160.54]
MKAHSKSYPRAKLRKIVKAHSRKRVGKTVDALVFLNFVLFIEERRYGGSKDELELYSVGSAVRNERVHKETRMALPALRGTGNPHQTLLAQQCDGRPRAGAAI